MPISDSLELVRNSGVTESALIVVRTEHRLANPGPLEAMLDACEIQPVEQKTT